MILTGDMSIGLGLISGLRGEERATSPLMQLGRWGGGGRDVIKSIGRMLLFLMLLQQFFFNDFGAEL